MGEKFKGKEMKRDLLNEATPEKTLRQQVESAIEGLTCNLCDFKADRRDLLSQHVKTDHEGNRYKCGQCDYSAKRPAHVRNHVKSSHARQFSCHQCDFRTAREP